MLAVAQPCAAAEPFPAGQAMEALTGVPYKLFARQRETQKQSATNCITSVIYALRQAGYQCPDRNFQQATRYWRPRAVPLELGKSPIGTHGALLMTREHFLLLYADTNGNGVIDADDEVIHAYYRPVEISRIEDWRKISPRYTILYIPINNDFPCSGEKSPSAR